PASRNRARAVATRARIVFTRLHDARVFELLGLVERVDAVEELRQIPVEHLDEAMRRVIGAVARDPAVLEMVGADFLRSLARADLAAAILGDRFLLLPHFHLVEARPQ